MTQNAAAPLPAPQPWLTVWRLALTRPSVANFEQLVQAPNVSVVRAGLWVFLSALVGYGGAGLLRLAIFRVFNSAYLGTDPTRIDIGAEVVGQLVQSLYHPANIGNWLVFTSSRALNIDHWQVLSGLLLTLTPIVAAVITVLEVLLCAAITQLLARSLGGTGTYPQLFFAFAAYLAPLTLVLNVLSLIPFVHYLALPLAGYGIWLNLVATKAVHQFEWDKTLAANGLIFGLGVVVLMLMVSVALIFLSTQPIGVYSQIVPNI